MYGGTCHVYTIWAELDNSHFLYVSAVSNIATTGNVHLKHNHVLGFVFSMSLVYCATTVAKVSLFSTCRWSTISFVLFKRRSTCITVNKHW